MTGADRVLAIAGPTASGKSALALGVALCLGGEIISADSMQVYRGLEIGTAKPGPAERSLVPHHLIDVADLTDDFTVARYQKLARVAVAGVLARGRLPVIVGGTGLYLRALLWDYDFSLPGPQAPIRASLAALAAKEGDVALHDQLRQVDPAAAARIHPRDVRRVVRALEVWQLTGRTLSSTWGEMHPVYNAVVIGLQVQRESLYRRIDERVDQMMALGLAGEVLTLMQRGYAPALVSGQALGYKEFVAYHQGQISLGEAVDILKRATRQYAKRQMTWLRREPGLVWLAGPGAGEGPVVDLACATAEEGWARKERSR